jgi:hypothetical protein
VFKIRQVFKFNTCGITTACYLDKGIEYMGRTSPLMRAMYFYLILVY